MCLFKGQSIIIRDFREFVHSVDFCFSFVHEGRDLTVILTFKMIRNPQGSGEISGQNHVLY